jgi:hypothetical protein
MHFDGTNGSQTFIDSSSYARTFTPNNAVPTLSTVNAMFGPSSFFPNAASVNDYASCPALPAFGLGDFTIEYWQKGGATIQIFAGVPTAFGWAIGTSGGQGAFTAGDGSTILNSSVTTPTNGSWHAMAWVRKTGTITCYVDGSSTASGASGTNFSDATTPFRIGYVSNSPNWPTGIYVDELRVSTTALYTSNYTPTGPFTS